MSLTDEQLQKNELLKGQILTEVGMQELVKLEIYKKLIDALTEPELRLFIEAKVVLNPIFSPASQSTIKTSLDQGTKIISMDINALKLFTSDEGEALSFLGHR